VEGLKAKTEHLATIPPSSSHANGELIVTSDLRINKNQKVFGINNGDQEHEIIGLNEYPLGEQVEVGSETIPLCLNHKATPGWSTKNITVNYKDESGKSKADRVAYISDISSPINLNEETLTGKTFNGDPVYSRLCKGTAAARVNERFQVMLFNSDNTYRIRVLNVYGYAHLGTLDIPQAGAEYYVTIGNDGSFNGQNDAFAHVYFFDFSNRDGYQCTQIFLTSNSSYERTELNSEYVVVVEYIKMAL
jgi:hypothetical protein